MPLVCRLSVVASISLALGCAPESSPEQGSEGSDSTGAATSRGTGSETDAADASSTGVVFEPIPARGINLEWVEVNQGVGVRVGENGAEVPPQQRTAFLLSNRLALVRAFWTIPDDWQPREIEAQLHLSYTDGSTKVITDRKMVEESSFIGDLNRSFYWGIMADEAQPGMRYHIELWETAPGQEMEPEPAPPPRLPLSGEAFVGIEGSYQVLKTVVVPFSYNDGDCVTEPDTSEETMQLFQDLMYMMNPIERLDFELHPLLAWEGTIGSFGEMHDVLVDLRFEEGAPPETYYYGLIDICAGGLNGAGGQANGIPPEPTLMDIASARVSAGLSIGADWSAETFVHEVGHSQGRLHVECNGMEGGPDPTYPFDGGDIGEWGFGVIDFGLRHPTFYKDYMTYCHPTWVSTWGWNKVFPVIRELSKWETQSRPADPYNGSLLVGRLLPDGRETWRTVPGNLGPATFTDDVRIQFTARSGRVWTQPTLVQAMPEDDGSRLIYTPLPDDFDRVTRLRRLQNGQRIAIERDAVRERHHLRTVFAKPQMRSGAR